MMANQLFLLPSVLIVLAIFCWLLTFVKMPGHTELLVWIGRKITKAGELKALNKRLQALSIPVSAEIFSACRLAITLLPIVLGGVLIITEPLRGFLFLSLAPAMWRLPNHILKFREKSRKEELEKEFSYMVSQVRIYSKASDHYQALKIVPFTLKGPLRREMEILSAELEMTDINEALENFTNRCSFQQAKDFAQVLIVAIRTGIDVNQILANFAKVTRQKRVNKLKRWIKVQPIIISILPASMLMVFMMMWILPMYSNIIVRLKSIN